MRLIDSQPQPVTVPLPCYGSEFQRKDPVCLKCPHNLPCQQAMGRRRTRIPVSEAKFQFLPENLAPIPTAIDPEATDLGALYSLSYQTIFEKNPEYLLNSSDAELRKIIIEGADENHCSLRLYILSVMLAHRTTSPDRPFFPAMLRGNSSLRVSRYRKACQEKFGTFDLESLDTLLGKETADLEKRLLQSEILAGNWIVGYKIRNSGNPSEPMFNQVELGLDPFWLAIEPAYQEILKRHLSQPFGTSLQNRHRHDVAQSTIQLKRNKKQACLLFKVREKIMSQAIGQVLSRWKFHPEDFEVENSPITNSIQFWSRLGLAIQHWACLCFIEGDETALTRF